MGAGRTDPPGRRVASRLAVLALAAGAFLALSSLDPQRASAVCSYFVPQELQFENGAQQRTRRANRSARVTGRVVCQDGRPATSGTVGMGEAVVVGSSGQLLVYGAQFFNLSPFALGAFEFEVAPGPSRLLTFAYFPPGGGANFSQQQLVLNMAARPKMKANRNHRRVGEKTEFFGSIPDYFVNGRPSVVLQAKSGRKWRTFKVVAVNANGKFSGVYRFTRTSRPTVYRFRAKIFKGGTDYPYLTRTSQKSKVFVRP